MLVRIKIFMMCAVFSLVCFASLAEEKNRGATPLQLSFYCPLQLAPENNDVYGLRLNFPYGVNNNVYGLDLGLWNSTYGNQYGLQLGGIGVYRAGNTIGLNFGGIVNISSGDEKGASFAGIYNQSDGRVTGLQFGGIVAKAQHVTGVQFGLITYAEDISGVQLGLLNICKNSAVPFMLIINAKY